MESEFKVERDSVVRIKAEGEFTVEVVPVAPHKVPHDVVEMAIRSSVFQDTREFLRRIDAIHDRVRFQRI